MTEEPKYVLAYDVEQRRPGCVLIQAAMGGDRRVLMKHFDSTQWETGLTASMKMISGTDDEWRRAAAMEPRKKRS